MADPKVMMLCMLLAMQLSCKNKAAQLKPGAAPANTIERAGVAIEYQDSGRGDTTLLLLHGWNINQGYWQHQVAHFSGRYRVVTLDLPGFGKSGKNRKDWTVEEYGKDIAAVVSRLDLKNIILIGHSMSGAIALEAASTHPGRVIGLVGVDNFTNYGMVLTPKLKVDIANAYQSLRSHYRQVVLQYAHQSLFAPSTDSAVRKRVIHDFLSVDTIMAVNILEQNDRYPTDQRLKTYGKVLYLINSDFHKTDTAAFHKAGVPFQLLNIGTTGHYPMIERPASLNLLLEQVIRLVGRLGPGA